MRHKYMACSRVIFHSNHEKETKILKVIPAGYLGWLRESANLFRKYGRIKVAMPNITIAINWSFRDVTVFHLHDLGCSL
jgi:hypothetical protein